MATRDEVMQAIRNADAAGDSAAVRRLGEYLSTMSAETAPPAQSQGSRERAQRAAVPGGAFLADLAAGAVRGAGSIGATILAPIDVASDALAGKGLSLESNRERRKQMDDALRTLGADTDSTAFKVGKVGAEVAGTLGVGGVLAPVARGMGASTALVKAISTAGMTAGPKAATLAGRAANTGVRMVGGAINGGASAALVDPGAAKEGAIVGAVLPTALNVAGATARVAGKAAKLTGGELKAVVQDDAARGAGELMRALDLTPEQLPGVIATLRAARAGASGVPPTVAQSLTSPQSAILERIVASGPGGERLRLALQAQAEARAKALQNVVPGAGAKTSVEAAENLGRTLVDEASPRYAAARKATSNAYASVDPFGDARLVLPAERADEAAAKFFGPGAGPMPGELSALLDDVRTLGQVVEAPRAPGVAIQAAGGAGLRPSASKSVDLDRDTLDVAVRKLGGVNIGKGGGELKWLRESDLGKPSVVHGPLARRDGGMDWDAMAQRVHGLGYIDDPDPRLLLDKLAESARGAPVMSMHGSEEALAASRGYYADMPDEMLKPTVTAGAVDYRTTQALRSRAGELAYKYGQSGDKRAASVAQAVRDQIDATLERTADRVVAGEAGLAGEYFTPDMARAVQEAKAARISQRQRYESGPAVGLWKNGADGVPVSQGAEAGRRFVNGGSSQLADAQQLRKMVASDGPSISAAREFILSDLLEKSVNAKGQISAEKLARNLDGRSLMLKELLTPKQLLQINALSDEAVKAAEAAGRGMGPGSNTYQNAANALDAGLLGSPFAKAVAARLPGMRAVAEPVRAQFAESASRAKAMRLADLLADPQAAAAALQGQAPSKAGAAARHLMDMGDAGFTTPLPALSGLSLRDLLMMSARKTPPVLAAQEQKRP